MSVLRRAGIKLLSKLPSSGARRRARHWRNFEQLESADIAFVSFPKSGRTFVRVMLARLYQSEFGIDERDMLKFSKMRRLPAGSSRIVFTHGGNAMRTPDKIRIDPKPFTGRKLVLLARHPGDVAVSRYFHLKHRSTDPVRQRLAAQPLDRFVWTSRGGIPSIVRYLNLWADIHRLRGDMLILRYEDFVARPESTLAELAQFIGLQADSQAIREAVEFARFENLQKMEREGYFSSTRMGPGRDGSESSYKVRSGKPGGFRAQLGDEGGTRVQAYVAENLDPVFGYG